MKQLLFALALVTVAMVAPQAHASNQCIAEGKTSDQFALSKFYGVAGLNPNSCTPFSTGLLPNCDSNNRRCNYTGSNSLKHGEFGSCINYGTPDYTSASVRIEYFVETNTAHQNSLFTCNCGTSTTNWSCTWTPNIGAFNIHGSGW